MSQPTEFIPNAGACLATTNVLEGRGLIRWMVREQSQDPVDNGWRIMSHIDDEEYLSTSDCWRVVDYNDLCNLEPALIEMYPLPIGSDLQLVRDEEGVRIVETATARQVLPRPHGSVPATPDAEPHEIAKREDAIASETTTALADVPGWNLALTSITFAAGAPPSTRCLLYSIADDDLDLDPWFADDLLPSLPFVGEVAIPPTVLGHLARHREAMPDRNGNLWTTMQYAVQRDGQAYFFACRYR